MSDLRLFLCVSIILLSMDKYIFIPEKKETQPEIMKKFWLFLTLAVVKHSYLIFRVHSTFILLFN